MSPKNTKISACPLDCFDSCEIVYENNTCKPSKTNKIANGSLCKPFAYMIKEKNLQAHDLEHRLKEVVKTLKQKNKSILHYKGTGNISALQNIPKIFFEKIKATIAVGNICEGAGEAGIELGREFNVNPPINSLLESEIIVVWGRNLSVTSKHIYKLIKDKTFITIDPYETEIAKNSVEYFAIPPKGDYQLIKQLNKCYLNEDLDEDMLIKLNTSKEQIQRTIALLKNKKVSFMMGLGAQKYQQGAQVIHYLETFAKNFGVFKEKNEGMWYLGDGKYQYDDKIAVKVTNSTSYPDVDFGKYDIVYIQGANPAISAPNTTRVVEGLKKAFVIYMGTTLNETAQYANIIIPAKTFLQKKDVRTSYGHDEVVFTDICEQTNEAISEYDFTKYLFDAFKLDGLLSQDEYCNAFLNKVREKPNVNFVEHKIDDIALLDKKDDEFYLISSKHEKSINSQFKYDNFAYVNPELNYNDLDEISISSIYAKVKVRVKNDKNIRKDCILLYAGNKLANHLTPHHPSDMGCNAIFQDVIVKISLE